MMQPGIEVKSQVVFRSVVGLREFTSSGTGTVPISTSGCGRIGDNGGGVCELSLVMKTSDCPPHLSSFQQFVERVALCRAVSHAAVPMTFHHQPGSDLQQHSESLESHRSRLD